LNASELEGAPEMGKQEQWEKQEQCQQGWQKGCTLKGILAVSERMEQMEGWKNQM
jgi:hypothetical protein